jgi:hypothetical protein
LRGVLAGVGGVNVSPETIASLALNATGSTSAESSWAR